MASIHECKTSAHRTDVDPPPDPFGFAGTLKGDASGALQVMSDALVCGSWVIPYSTIEAAHFVFPSQRGTAVKLPIAVLRVRSRGTTYDFGVVYTDFWRGTLPFQVKREGEPPQSALFSKRFWFGAAVLVAVYVVWQVLNSG